MPLTSTKTGLPQSSARSFADSHASFPTRTEGHYPIPRETRHVFTNVPCGDMYSRLPLADSFRRPRFSAYLRREIVPPSSPSRQRPTHASFATTQKECFRGHDRTRRCTPAPCCHAPVAHYTPAHAVCTRGVRSGHTCIHRSTDPTRPTCRFPRSAPPGSR
eukprot:4477377-Prymnesium_polylepis.2